MAAKNIRVVQAQQKIDIHARGAEYLSPASWNEFTSQNIKILAAMILGNATGNAEKRRFGSATIAFDPATIAAITGAIGQIQKAIAGSKAVWLPGAEEAQERLPAAKNDRSFQCFMKTMGDSTEQRTDISGAKRDRDSLNKLGEK